LLSGQTAPALTAATTQDVIANAVVEKGMVALIIVALSINEVKHANQTPLFLETLHRQVSKTLSPV